MTQKAETRDRMQAHDTDEWEWIVENGADPVCSSADLHKARSMWTRHHPSVECPSPQLMQPQGWPDLWLPLHTPTCEVTSGRGTRTVPGTGEGWKVYPGVVSYLASTARPPA